MVQNCWDRLINVNLSLNQNLEITNCVVKDADSSHYSLVIINKSHVQALPRMQLHLLKIFDI